MIQSWRGQASLAEAARAGYRGVLSFGYYLDHLQPARSYYGVDPLERSGARIEPGAEGSNTGRRSVHVVGVCGSRNHRFASMAERGGNRGAVVVPGRR